MTRRSIITTGIVALVALALAAPAAFSRGPDKGERGARMMQQLDLAPEQVTALQALREEQQADAKATRQELRTKRQAIRAQWLSGTPDRAAILALTSELSSLEAQLATDRVDFLFAAQGILTPAQFAQFVQRHGKRGFPGMRGGKRGDGKQGFHGRGWGKRDGKRGFGKRGGKRGFGKHGGAFTGPPAPEADTE